MYRDSKIDKTKVFGNNSEDFSPIISKIMLDSKNS